MKRLTDDRVIGGLTIDVDPATLGLGVSAYVYVRIKQNSWKSFRDNAWARDEAVGRRLGRR